MVRTTSGCLIVLFGVCTVSRAEGLLYKLPADGVKVNYEAKISLKRGDAEVTAESASLSMASVGTETVDGEKCRWIEFKLQMDFMGREQTHIAKVLIPEKHLQKGADPMKHARRGWLKSSTRDEPRSLEEARDKGPLPVFLAGPLSNEKKLDEKVIETKLGKLKCPGVSGTRKIDQENQQLDVTVHSWLNDKVPFGVAAAKFELEMSRDGELQVEFTMELTATDVVKDARTELPENN